jgi:SNF2-related domain
VRAKKEMRPYQDRVATHLYEHDAALAVIRPGGGKTVAALTAIEELKRDKVIRHALVIAPKRVARVVWPDELDLWKHIAKLRYKVLDGSPIARELELLDANMRLRDLTIVGLDVAQWLVDTILPFPKDHPIFDLLVIDEISRLRNPKGERAKALAKVADRFKMIWGLSGTLRPNSAQDLFTPARVVTRGKLWGRSFYKWRQERFYPTDYNGYNWAPLPGAEDKINAELAPYIATVAEDELKQPEPTIIFDKVTLPPGARQQYDSMERRLLTGAGEAVIVAANSAVATGKLAQLANGFVYDTEGGGGAIDVHAAKFDWLEDIKENATGPTLLVYEYQEDLVMLRSVFGDLPYLGAGVSDAKAGENIMLWNRGLLPFMGLHPASGGHGLNLQHGGSDMAWIGPTWSPEYWEQTIARINRSGQARQVIIRVCVAEQTVDEMKLSRVFKKMSAQEAFEAYLRARQTRNKAA